MTGLLPSALNTPAVLRHKYINLEWDASLALLRLKMNIRPVQCFSLAGLRELQDVFDAIDAAPGVVRHVVLTSEVAGVFNFGGDLALFVLLARAKDKKSLVLYGKKCLDLVSWVHTGVRKGVLCWSLIEGDALGGGLESALPCPRLIATRDAQIGFPEVLFNLFPGMGAWPFTTRRAGRQVATELILSGKVQEAQGLLACGLVDAIVEPGTAWEQLLGMVRAVEPRFRGTVMALCAELNHDEVDRKVLNDTVEAWADGALALTDRDLRLMERLVRAQLKKVGGQAEGAVEEIKRMELEDALAAERMALAA